MKNWYSIFGVVTVLLFSSCEKEETKEDSTTSNNTSQELFFSFHTPDWERTIPCDNIDFYPTNEISAGVAFVSATSASTNATFGFPWPSDSSAMNLEANIQQYNVADYSAWGGGNQSAFELSLKLNKTGVEDTDRLLSVAGLSADNYNEITSIEYIGTDGTYANFKVKGNYKMNMVDMMNSSDVRQVTGSYCIKFRTNRQ